MAYEWGRGALAFASGKLRTVLFRAEILFVIGECRVVLNPPDGNGSQMGNKSKIYLV